VGLSSCQFRIYQISSGYRHADGANAIARGIQFATDDRWPLRNECGSGDYAAIIMAIFIMIALSDVITD
jgi:hypothetical protein